MTNSEILKLHNNVMEAWNQHDTKKFLSYVDENITWYDIAAPQPLKGKSGVEEFFNGWKTAFPDFKLKTMNTVIADDKIAVELEFTGTNTGPMKIGDQPEIRATNKKVNNRGTYFGKVKNGKFIEVCTYPDLAGMLQQLGIVEMHEAHA